MILPFSDLPDTLTAIHGRGPVRTSTRVRRAEVELLEEAEWCALRQRAHGHPGVVDWTVSVRGMSVTVTVDGVDVATGHGETQQCAFRAAAAGLRRWMEMEASR